MEKLTLETIGKLAGVSRATVSRVINDVKTVDPALREKVLKVIKQTGYKPNLAARSLVSRRSDVIGLVIPRHVKSIFGDPFFPLLIQGLTQACNAHNYTLALFLAHNQTEEETLYARVFNKSMVDGVIISSPQLNDPLISRFVENKQLFISIGYPGDFPGVSFVSVDNVSSSKMAVNHLLQQGYKNIATITGPLNTSVGRERWQGYCDALKKRALPLKEELVVEADFTEFGGYLAMQSLINYKPDAVFIASDSMAYGAIRAIHDADLKIPDDIALVGFDDLETSAMANISLTTIRQPVERTGLVAVENLLDMFENGPDPARRILLPTQLIVRNSCGATI